MDIDDGVNDLDFFGLSPFANLDGFGEGSFSSWATDFDSKVLEVKKEESGLRVLIVERRREILIRRHGDMVLQVSRSEQERDSNKPSFLLFMYMTTGKDLHGVSIEAGGRSRRLFAVKGLVAVPVGEVQCDMDHHFWWLSTFRYILLDNWVVRASVFWHGPTTAEGSKADADRKAAASRPLIKEHSKPSPS